MSLSIGNLRGDGLIPPAAVDFLKRRSIEAAGLVLAGLALAFVVALLPFDPADPSLHDRTRVVKGKSVPVRADPGGRRLLNNQQYEERTTVPLSTNHPPTHKNQ